MLFLIPKEKFLQICILCLVLGTEIQGHSIKKRNLVSPNDPSKVKAVKLVNNETPKNAPMELVNVTESVSKNLTPTKLTEPQGVSISKANSTMPEVLTVEVVSASKENPTDYTDKDVEGTCATFPDKNTPTETEAKQTNLTIGPQLNEESVTRYVSTNPTREAITSESLKASTKDLPKDSDMKPIFIKESFETFDVPTAIVSEIESKMGLFFEMGADLEPKLKGEKSSKTSHSPPETEIDEVMVFEEFSPYFPMDSFVGNRMMPITSSEVFLIPNNSEHLNRKKRATTKHGFRNSKREPTRQEFREERPYETDFMYSL